MLEDQGAYLLKRYIGNYVLGVSKEALNISDWQGFAVDNSSDQSEAKHRHVGLQAANVSDSAADMRRNWIRLTVRSKEAVFGCFCSTTKDYGSCGDDIFCSRLPEDVALFPFSRANGTACISVTWTGQATTTNLNRIVDKVDKGKMLCSLLRIGIPQYIGLEQIRS
ncbi:hypothetical protein M8C21_010134 [Ambrosia artemisiifolia]|uniref:Uncharacterized protein n=1 Tax=Ambrosia artemisiifolia TaxID=4212 RepID=A0AAD5GVU2_AMBAR|nr:hypothetical protein M8C21_010134 [Ambrosia artemisiifolia]